MPRNRGCWRSLVSTWPLLGSCPRPTQPGQAFPMNAGEASTQRHRHGGNRQFFGFGLTQQMSAEPGVLAEVTDPCP